MEAPSMLVLDALLGPGEDTEGLSSSAVQEQLHKVDVRREEVLLTLYASIVERWSAAEDVPATDAAALEADAAFCSALLGLQERGLAEGEPAVAEVLAAAAQHAEVCAQLRQTLEAAGGIRLTAELQQRLADFDTQVAQGSYTEAAWTAVELQKACQSVPPGDDAPAQVAARTEPFTQLLQAAVYSYVSVDPATCMPQLAAVTAAAGSAPGPEAAAAAAAWGAAAELVAQQQQAEAEGGEEGGGPSSAGDSAGGAWGEEEGNGGGAFPGAAAASAPGSEAISRADSLSTAAPGAAGDAGSSGASGEPPVAAALDATAGVARQQLGEVWAALGVLGLLGGALRALARFVLERSVGPILASPADPSLLTDSPAVSIASTSFSRATTLGGGGGGRGEGHSSVERLLYKALRGLTEEVLCGNAEYVGQLGSALWPQLSSAYITTQLKPIQPQEDTEVEGFSRRSSLGAKLEAKAVKLGLLPAGKEGPITRYIRITVGRLLAARRDRLVAAARDLLTSPTAHETVQVAAPQAAPLAAAGGGASGGPQRSLFDGGRGGRPRRPEQQQPAAGASTANGGLEGDAAVLATAEYTVSQAAEQVVGLLRDALAEACSSGNAAVAQCMCAVVVEVAGLVAQLPTASPGELLLPFPAALRHNDCHYVYQALLVLPQQFSPRLQRLVHRGVSFAAPAARVRKAGDDCLEAMLLRQEEELGGLVDGFEGFASLDGPGTIRCRKVVMQLLHSFRRLGSVLRGVLPPAVYVDVAARLVQAVCLRLIGEIMSMPDISVDESEQIPKILEEFASGVLDSLLQAAPGPGAGGGAAPSAAEVMRGAALADAMQRQLEEKTPAVMKLRELLELLDIRLVEIRRRWVEGRLPALGFSAGEVAHAVRALFDHSDLRRDFLAQLEAETLR